MNCVWLYCKRNTLQDSTNAVSLPDVSFELTKQHGKPTAPKMLNHTECIQISGGNDQKTPYAEEVGSPFPFANESLH